jgi:hypothetical protein
MGTVTLTASQGRPHPLDAVPRGSFEMRRSVFRYGVPLAKRARPVTDYLCNGYECECGARIRVCHNDRSKPMPHGRGYVGGNFVCTGCGRSRWLTWKDIMALPLVWTEEGP